MVDQSQVQPNPVAASSAESCTVEMIPRHLRMHSVSESELDQIASGNPSIHWTFFGICLGAVISFGIVLRTPNVDSSSKVLFQMLLFSSLIMGVYFGVRGVRDLLKSKKKLQDIKSSSGQPLSSS